MAKSDFSHTISANQQAQDVAALSPSNIYQTVDLAPGLYLVSTPIGNLRDISLRALDVLASASLVLAEDTRVSRKLMNAYQLSPPLSAYHDHNAAKRVPNLVKRIQEGASIALISDAGTPLVSDPGFKLARACIDEKLPVIAVPGASAVLSGLLSSGLACDKFMFAGFLPAKSAARRRALGEFVTLQASLIFFESAKRLSKTLVDMQAVLGDRPVAIARELTKKYEEVLHGSTSELITRLADKTLRGEIVVIVGPGGAHRAWDSAAIKSALQERISDMGVKRACTEVAGLCGHKKSDIYALALTLKNDTQ